MHLSSSFHRKPEVEKVEYDVATDSQKTEVIVSWDEKYLDLAKCVDYFYVEYARLPPDAAIEFGPQDRSNISDKPSNGVTTNLAYSVVSVRLERKKLLDEWEDSIRPLVTRYVAKVKVEPEANYTFRVSLHDDVLVPDGTTFSRASTSSTCRRWPWTRGPDGATSRAGPSSFRSRSRSDGRWTPMGPNRNLLKVVRQKNRPIPRPRSGAESTKSTLRRLAGEVRLDAIRMKQK